MSDTLEWTLKEGDVVLSAVALRRSAVSKWLPTQHWSEPRPGTIPKDTVGHIIDVSGERDLGEILVEFTWQDEEGYLYSSIAPLNSEQWVEKVCFEDYADEEYD